VLDQIIVVDDWRNRSRFLCSVGEDEGVASLGLEPWSQPELNSELCCFFFFWGGGGGV
jgi:hypothetical protein